jgi:hypothetical protein
MELLGRDRTICGGLLTAQRLKRQLGGLTRSPLHQPQLLGLWELGAENLAISTEIPHTRPARSENG